MGSGTGLADGLARCTLIVVNILFFLCGGVILSFGIISLVNPTLIVNLLNMIPNLDYLQYYVNITQLLLNNAILLISIGGVIVLTTLVGCVVAVIRGNRLIIIYITLVLLLCLFELAVIMWASIEREQIHMRFADIMYSSLTQNFKPIQTINNNNVVYVNSTAALAWEDLQFKYSCCGARNYTDYQQFSWDNSITANGFVYTNAVVPPSCCLQVSLYYIPTPTTVFVDLSKCFQGSVTSTIGRVTKGCYVAIIDQLSQYLFVMGIVLASLIAIEIFVIILAIGAMKRIVKPKPKM